VDIAMWSFILLLAFLLPLVYLLKLVVCFFKAIVHLNVFFNQDRLLLGLLFVFLPKK